MSIAEGIAGLKRELGRCMKKVCDQQREIDAYTEAQAGYEQLQSIASAWISYLAERAGEPAGGDGAVTLSLPRADIAKRIGTKTMTAETDGELYRIKIAPTGP